MTHRLCVIPGDGIGKEVIGAAVEVLSAAVPDLECFEAQAGFRVFEQTGQSVPDQTLALMKECGAGLFGAVSSPSTNTPGYKSAILQLRQRLGLGANIRPIESRWSKKSRPPIRLVIVRENSEGLYIGDETSDGNTAIAKRVITRGASRRIGRIAAEIAHRFALSRIHIVHKANILPQTDGLFRDSVLTSLHQYQSESCVEFDIHESLVDIAAYRLAATPEDFGVLVTTNLYGDILSDLAAFHGGGMGRAPSLNWGEGLCLAEPVHGSAPDIEGQGIADPTAAILSAAMLCRLYWQQPNPASAIESALHQTVQEFDRMKSESFTTRRFTLRVLQHLESVLAHSAPLPSSESISHG